MNKPTYIIKRSQIENIYSMEDYVKTVEKAFKLYGQGKVQMPPKVYLYFEKGDLRCMPVYIPSMKIAGVKNVTIPMHSVIRIDEVEKRGQNKIFELDANANITPFPSGFYTPDKGN